MRQSFIREGVNTAKFFQVDNEEVLAAALESLKLPVIVKATDLQGSKGIYIAHTQEEAYAGFRAAMELTKKDYCIVEEYIVGWEFGAQAFVYKNEVFFVMPHGDETYMSHTAVPIGHYVPLQEEPLVIAKIEDEVKKAIRAIGLNNCAVNVDMILRDGKVYMIELTGRAGANCLPELVEINFGVAYYKMIAAMALSENPAELWAGRNKVQQAGLARMMMSKDKAGIIENIYYDGKWTEDILEITFFKGVGDTVNRFETSNDCIGQVIVKGNSLEDCQARVSEIMSEVKIEGLK